MKKLYNILLALILILSSSVNTFAANNNEMNYTFYPQKSYLPQNGKEHFEEIYRNEQQARVEYLTVYGYDYKKDSVAKYGSWRNGVSGGSSLSTATLTFNYTYDETYNISFTASVSGSYTNGSTIGSSLGVSLGNSKRYSLGSGYSVSVPKGSRYLIKYRPVYYTYTVTETKYLEAYIPGVGWDRHVVGTKTCYVDVFSHWDFTHVNA